LKLRLEKDKGEYMAGGLLRIGAATGAALIAGSLMVLSGCHTKKLEADMDPAGPNTQMRTAGLAAASAKKVGGAGAAIVSACRTESYDNAGKGLIVSETGLEEDVLDLRDRTSYKGVPFALKETERLEALLRNEAGESGGSKYPRDQAACIRQFADYMQTLTDPLVEANAEQNRLDVSAFDNASKEAQQEIEQEEKVIQQPPAHP